ncbi:MAG: DUF3881 family protein [Lachnospiraceae bacterium]|nr:DUF3881 family protein [Lachnospiraceae bacterium]
MHRFLRAIGFSNINNRKNMDKLLGIILSQPDVCKKAELSPDRIYTEFRKEFAHHAGIVVRGEYDEKGFFHIEHYFPYLESTFLSVNTDITVNKRVDTDAYTGMCDDLRLGISLIFYLQNAVDYLLLDCNDNTPHKAKTILSGLSLNGTIILGIENTEDKLKKKTYRSHMRNQLIAMAKSGDQDAIDSLTVDEIDLSAQINRRIKNEDLYSLVETSFVPYGSESDNYSILGTIINWSVITNSYTGEEIYQLLISCNDIIISVGINKTDLLGEPMIGRRFKGVIWMQGLVDFQKV